MGQPTGRDKDFPYSVSGLTRELKGVLEKGFSKIFLEAEISGWKRYPSGHCYFTLKDAEAQISAVMFASRFERCKAREDLKDGAKVEVYGSVTVYPPRGNYQLTVYDARLAGVGDLMTRYLELKAKLEAEGLFDAARKRPLPFLPRRIGLVTSEAGAVVHDMCTVLTRRFPALEIRLFPCLVQGDEAPATIVAGIRHFNGCADWRADLLIVGRGGGSFEDLFCFNDESLVRAVAGSAIPVISAVGHETDFTLCDFAADKRAGTPSIAAEIAVPRLDELLDRLENNRNRLVVALRGKEEWATQRVDQLSDGLVSALSGARLRAETRLANAGARLAPAAHRAADRAAARLDGARARLEPAAKLLFSRAEARLGEARKALALLSPYGVLERGYAIVTDAQGAVVRAAAAVKPGDGLGIRLGRGRVRATAQEVEDAAP